MKDTVGRRIREIRNSKGIKATFLAKKLGIHPSTLGKYEHGDRKVNADFLPEIADALGVDVSVFYKDQLDETSTSAEKAV